MPRINTPKARKRKAQQKIVCEHCKERLPKKPNGRFPKKCPFCMHTDAYGGDIHVIRTIYV